MLGHCAPDAKIVLGTHCNLVHFKSLTAQLQRGSKSERDPSLKAGHIRTMVRHLGIDPDCASSQLQAIAFGHGPYGLDDMVEGRGFLGTA